MKGGPGPVRDGVLWWELFCCGSGYFADPLAIKPSWGYNKTFTLHAHVYVPQTNRKMPAATLPQRQWLNRILECALTRESQRPPWRPTLSPGPPNSEQP